MSLERRAPTIHDLLAVNDHLLGEPAHLGSDNLQRARSEVERYASSLEEGNDGVPSWFKRAVDIGRNALPDTPIQATKEDIGVQ